MKKKWHTVDKKGVDQIDHEQDPVIHAAVDAIMHENQLDVVHNLQLQPVTVTLQRRRKEIAKELFDFKKRLNSGYQALLDELKQFLAVENTEEDPLAPFTIGPDMRVRCLKIQRSVQKKCLRAALFQTLWGFLKRH